MKKYARLKLLMLISLLKLVMCFSIKIYKSFVSPNLILRRFLGDCTFCKIKTTSVPKYLSDLTPQTNHLYNTCAAEDVTIFYSRTDAFKYFILSISSTRMEQT